MTTAGRVAGWVAAAARLICRLAPRSLPSAFVPEFQATLADACEAAYARGGWRSLLATGVAETVDVARQVVAARLGVVPSISTVRSIDHSRISSRRPLMITTDLRRAWRRLRARPSVALGAAAMLALGIGLTTSMFSLADSLLLRPVPFRDPGTLAAIMMFGGHTGRGFVSPAVLHAWQSSSAFASVQGASDGTALIDTPGGVIGRTSAWVTPGVFGMLGVKPIRGRLFTATEGRAGADDPVLISESVWRGAYGSDPGILGRAMEIDGAPVTIIGVMPIDFHFPKWDTTIWRPIDYAALATAQAQQVPSPYVRFASGTPQADGLALLTRLAHDADPTTNGQEAQAMSLAGFAVDPYYQRALPVLGAGVTLVFLVLCANASSLILASFSARRREFGLCAALGASRFRVLREAIVEAFAIGTVGSIAGLVLAMQVIALAQRFLPDAFLVRTLNPLELHGRAVAAAMAAGIIAILIAGVLPAWRATRGNTTDSLREGGRSGTSSPRARRMMRGLIAAEVALACMLLVGSTLLVRSFLKLVNTDRGLDVSRVISTWTNLPVARYPDAASRIAATRAVQDSIEALPGVESTAVSFGVPPSGGNLYMYPDWRSDAPGAQPVRLDVNSFAVTPGFLQLYGIPIVRGRDLIATDSADTAVISEHLASALWPSGDPIGHAFLFAKQRYHVVGVSREVTLPSPDARVERPEFYTPFTAGGSSPMISVRCHGTCPDPAIIRQRILASAPGAVVNRVAPAETPFIAQVAPPRAAASLSMIFAGVAFLAAAGGLFSVLTYAVGKREREFGIRAALGASPPQIRAVVLRDGLSVAAWGVVIGAGLSWMLGRALGSLEYGASIGDVATWAPPFLLIALASLAAVWRPARRAMRVDPALLLRGE
jgi:predicted permease